MNRWKSMVIMSVTAMIAACGGSPDDAGTDRQPVIGKELQSECLPVGVGDYGASGSVEVRVDGDAITVVDHYAEFNCCLEVRMEVDIDGTDITVVELEDPEGTPCYCICPYELSIGISNLEDGLYTVKVYRKAMTPPTDALLHVETVCIGDCVVNPECQAPIDCIHLPWEVYCQGHWGCMDNQCVEVCDMEGCGDGECDAEGGESIQSCRGDCQPTEDDSVEVLVDADTITVVDHFAEFNCCLEVLMEVSIDGTDITVVEVEDPEGDPCYCICPYELSAEISNLEDGLYTVKLYRQAVTPPKDALLHVETVCVGDCDW